MEWASPYNECGMTGTVSTFRYAAAESDLDELFRRLRTTRWPEALQPGNWDYGASVADMKAICDRWRTVFDWRHWEARIFSQPHVLYSDPDGTEVHALHLRGEGPAPFPILLSHGWPGSFLEFLNLAEHLAFPSRFGGDAADAFDVIAPSLPGFGFSSSPRQPGFNHFDIADLFTRMMGALGYTRFVAQGGDIGASVATAMGLRHPDKLAAVHLNFIPFSYQPHLQSAPDTAERDFLEHRAAWTEAHGGYANVQRSEPETVALGLNDSPAGLAAWIVQRFRDWSPPVPGVLDPQRLDHILANLTLYWLTGTIATACRLYKDMRGAPLRLDQGQRVNVPTAVACFPHELPMPPRSWVARGFDLRRWTTMPQGGHFAALDEPDLLADDLREFMRPLRG